MKPNFALNLSEDRIGLLQRTGKGWLPLGEVMFGAPDMEDQLTALRETAAHRAPRGIWTKLVIPNSQILYTTVTVTAATDVAKRDEIRAALAGRTPYAVEDLAFDWSGDGPDVQVAVVARETLDEAESFAADRAFRPMSFVAIPGADQFDGEPMFGATAFSAAALGKGRRLERDLVPIHVVGAGTAEPEPTPEEIEVAEVEVEVEVEEAAAPEAPVEADAVIAAAEEVTPEVIAEPDAMVEAVIAADAVADVAADLPDENPAAPLTTVDVFPEATEVAPPAPRFTIAAVTDPASSVVSAQVPDMDDEAPFADVSDQVADAIQNPVAGDDDLPPAPSTAALMAFASRRGAPEVEVPPAGVTEPGARPVGPAPERGSVTTMPGLLADRLAARAQTGSAAGFPARETSRAMSGGAASGAFVTAPSVPPGSKKRKPVAASTVTASMATTDLPRKPLTKPGGTFASSQPVRGKPRYLGLILTGILILFLALLAAWSSFFLASRGDEATGTEVAGAEFGTPIIDEEMLADGQVPEDVALNDGGDVPVAEPPADVAIDAPPPEAIPDTPEVAAVTPPEDAIAATEPAGPAPETGVDVFGGGTTGPAAVTSDLGEDAIFLSRADTPLVPSEVADLAAPVAVSDAVPAAQLPPPPFGTVYVFNPNGTIQGTPDGIMTPDGVRLVAGEPALVPPARPAAIATAVVPEVSPEVLPALTDTAGPEPTVIVSDPALADARPRSRPVNLVVPDDDAALPADDQPVRAASLRPRGRPDTVLAAGDAARLATESASLATASAAAGSAAEAAILAIAAEPDMVTATPSGSRLAVSVSRIPAPRPRDLERAVAAALAAATRAPDPEPEPEPIETAATAPTAPEADAEPEIEAASSQAPTSGSVADRATFVNAITLSRINLIGVYGSQSNRYALVRQGNGRYKRVEVGDRIDGGTVAAITANEVRYQKGGRLIALQMPDT
jgi:hypothetical protein